MVRVFFQACKAIAGTTLIIAVMGVCCGFLYFSFRFATGENVSSVLNDLVGARYEAGPITEESARNYQDIVEDHQSVVRWELECLHTDSINNLSKDKMAELKLPWESFYSIINSDNSNKATRDMFHPERQLISLSKSISEKRFDLIGKASGAYAFWEITAILAIVLGMVTTILVSMSSTEFGRGDGHVQRIIRVLAIIFPALGTATAAVTAFYSPQNEWSQSSRTLASLTQLQGQMAIGVWDLKCADTDDEASEGPLKARLKEWSGRYVDIQTVSSAAGGTSTSAGGEPKPQENSSGGKGGGGGESGANTPASSN